MPTSSHCADLVRRYDHDQFLCILQATEADREGLFALRAFNLEVAKIPERIREPLAGEMRLQWWRDALEGIYDGRRPDHPVGGPLADTIAEADLPVRAFTAYLDARHADLEEEGPADLAALETYARETSGTLSELAAAVLGAPDPDTASAARQVGTAWGLAGLARSIPFHAAAGRSFLPRDLCKAGNLSPTPREGGPALAMVVAEMAAAAHRHLDGARSLRASVSERALPVLLPARLIDGYLKRLERAAFDPFSGGTPAPALWRFIRLGVRLPGRW